MSKGLSEVRGVLELTEQGDGHLRDPKRNYRIDGRDVFVGRDLVRKYALRGAEVIRGSASGDGRRGPRRLADIDTINDSPADEYIESPDIQDLTPIDPAEQIRFEIPGGSLSMRIIDLLTPIGKGQRGLICAPPRTGKTMLLQQMAAGTAANHPEIYMIVLLVDERPEEVTEMRRSVHGEVVASNNDQDIASHVRIARLVIERAKRLVESGQDVLVLMDSLTRLGRAFNAHVGSSGRTMSGGLDIRALVEPKAIFGAARNIEGGGSLTIVATALIDTGSRMDELIFNEFKGTGNMEIMLSRELANRRIWPAMDLNMSGTRKEELLLSEKALKMSHRIRRRLTGRDPIADMQTLLASLSEYPSNEEWLANRAE
jgi:transcription termination factor Rho